MKSDPSTEITSSKVFSSYLKSLKPKVHRSLLYKDGDEENPNFELF